MTDTEKWEAKAREIAPDPGFAALRLRIAAALAEAYAEGEREEREANAQTAERYESGDDTVSSGSIYWLGITGAAIGIAAAIHSRGASHD